MVRNHKRFRLLCIKCRKKLIKQTIKLELKGLDSMEMPIDLVVISNLDLKKDMFQIKNLLKKLNMKFSKMDDIFEKLNQTYSFSVFVADSSGIENVIIDPTYRLGDNYMLNNELKR